MLTLFNSTSQMSGLYRAQIDTLCRFRSLTILDVASPVEEHKLVLPIIETFQVLDMVPSLIHLALIGVRFKHFSESYPINSSHVESLESGAVVSILTSLSRPSFESLSIRSCSLSGYDHT
jgi:hypothetical protein